MTSPSPSLSIEAYLQILARISPLPVANNWLVGLGATEITVQRLENTSPTDRNTHPNSYALEASSVRFR